MGSITITAYSDSSTVCYCEVMACGTGIEVQGRYGLVKGNYLHDMTMILNQPGNESDYGADGILVENARNEICYNRLLRCKAPCYMFGGYDGKAIELYGDCDTCLFHNNIAVGCDGFTEIGADSAQGSTINTKFYYNIAINSRNFVCLHLNDHFQTRIQNLCMDNNTILDTLLDSIHPDVIDFCGPPTKSTFLFRNDIVFVKDFAYLVGTVNAGSGWAFTHVHNLYFLDSSIIQLNMTLDSTEALGNPLFVNYPDTNLHLTSSSPAISDGLSLGYSLDYYNTPVPTTPSLGAVQYVTAMDNFDFQNGVAKVEIGSSAISTTPQFKLSSAYPNPFQGLVKIAFDVPTIAGVAQQAIEISIFDLNGSLVKQLASGKFSAGHYEIPWNCGEGPRGATGSSIYIVRMKAPNFDKRLKLVRVL